MMKTVVYPVGPTPKSDAKYKAIVVALGVLLLGGITCDITSGTTVTQEGHVISNIRKQRSYVFVDRGPNQGDTIKASWKELLKGNKPVVGEKVVVTSKVGGLTGLKYTNKISR